MKTIVEIKTERVVVETRYVEVPEHIAHNLELNTDAGRAQFIQHEMCLHRAKPYSTLVNMPHKATVKTVDGKLHRRKAVVRTDEYGVVQHRRVQS